MSEKPFFTWGAEHYPGFVGYTSTLTEAKLQATPTFALLKNPTAAAVVLTGNRVELPLKSRMATTPQPIRRSGPALGRLGALTRQATLDSKSMNLTVLIFSIQVPSIQ